MPRLPRNVPASTYRLQLHPDFTFRDAEGHLDYFADLGITHLYLSPVTAAVPGSTHGYDVIDPSRVNPELGGEDGLRALASAAGARGLGLILDIVPNHMSTSHENWRWADVLRLGRGSPFAHWFDIDWEARDEVAHRGKVLLPVLGDDLETVLARGELTVDHDAGGTWIRYFERRFPLAPGTEASSSTEGLRSLLEAQHYVLDYWRAAKSHVDYRRFFTIDELVGVRVEDFDVFTGTHALFGQLAAEGMIAGVRVDHADGLSDPTEYFRRLRALLGADAYIVAEKILGPDERLPEGWPIEGTTGYEFMADVAALQTDDAQREAIEAVYVRDTGRDTPYDDLAHESRLRILDGSLAGPLQRAARQLHRALGPQPALEAFSAAIRALLACLPVYRTYHTEAEIDPGANAVIKEATRRARLRHPKVDAGTLTSAAAVLARPQPGARIAVMRLQQLMPAVAAKAIEDSAFYRYIPLLSLDEVGGDPVQLRVDAAGFHARNSERARRWPASMLATATHDHKRGEDVRARLGALSELPREWAAFLGAFHAAAGPAPAALEGYRAAQTLAAMWPEEAGPEAERLTDRLAAYLVKSAREAAERTSWDAPDAAYESSLEAYAAAAVEAMQRLPVEPRGWLSRLARHGLGNTLAQVLLRVCAPGVPDTYQGAEFRDDSLVDPDNRRAVDYSARAAVLARLDPLLADTPAGSSARRADVERLMRSGAADEVKLYVLARSLRRRRELHPLFITGLYRPLDVRGPHAAHALAFARRLDDRWAVAAVTLHPAGLESAAGDPPDWAETALLLPAELTMPLEDALTGAVHRPTATGAGGMLPLSAVLGTLPVALLEPASP
ncbi:MAG: malto-oligosyltrehalose synthase [Dehalococcoidia bacterium]